MKTQSSIRRWVDSFIRACGQMCLFMVGLNVLTPPALAQAPALWRYEPIQAFRSGPKAPASGLMLSADGLLYGCSSEGGANNQGTIFRMSSNAGLFETLVEFTGNGSIEKGADPVGVLVEWMDASNNRFFYGVTAAGGSFGFGTIFRMTPEGDITTLVHFTGVGGAKRGASPPDGLILAADGNFYGVTNEGGLKDEGTVFRMTPGGVLTTLFDFDSEGFVSNARNPRAALIETTTSGSFFGVASGGDHQDGVVFQIDWLGNLSVKFHFDDSVPGNPGSGPNTALIRASDGNYYGTTAYGGGYDDFYKDQGTVYQMTPGGVHTAIAGFLYPIPGEHRGMRPGPLIEGQDGFLYGTTFRGGWNDRGVIFRVGKSGGMTTLIDFDFDLPPKGSGPMGRLVQVANNEFMGVTTAGGDYNAGTIFRVFNIEDYAADLNTVVSLSGRGPSNEPGPEEPSGGLTQGTDGRWYGTTMNGGVYGKGTVFLMNEADEIVQLVDFTGNGSEDKGAMPMGNLVQASNGQFYGVTNRGGNADLGTLFRMTSDGNLTTLIEFTGNSGLHPGSYPDSGLTDGGDGFLYGSTTYGGSHDRGVVFRIDLNGAWQTLVQFDSSGPAYPSGTLWKGSDAQFYGMTSSGGTSGNGVAFRMTSAGVLTSFAEFDSLMSNPKGLIEGSDGNFYAVFRGTGSYLPFLGVVAFDYGSVVQITPEGDLMTIASFYGDAFNLKGKFPQARLVEGPDGFLYGTTSSGGSDGHGTIFRCAMHSGYAETLFELTGTEGDFPGSSPNAGPMSQGSDGNLYGITSSGGVDHTGKPAGLGQIYRLRLWDHRNDKPLLTPTAPPSTPVAQNAAWDASAAGIYDGLLHDQTDPGNLLGALNKLTLSRSGVVSATIQMNGQKAKLRGILDGSGVLAVDLLQSDASVIEVRLQLMLTDDGDGWVLRGTIQWHGLTAMVDLPQAPFRTRENPAPPAIVSRYTLVLPSQVGWGTDEPGGDGWASVTVSSGGTVTVRGRLGDGTSFTESAYLSAGNEVSLYAELYRKPNHGRIGGKLVFRDIADVSDCDGMFHWKKFADDREVRYPLGFDLEIWAIGSRYTAPPRNSRVLDQLPDHEYNASLSLINPSFLNENGQIERALSWKRNNQIVHYGPEILGARCNPRDGVLTGRYIDPWTQEILTLSGVAFQKQGIAAGVAILRETSAALRIQPDANPSYPGSENDASPRYASLPSDSPNEIVTDDLGSWDRAAAGVYLGTIHHSDGSLTGALENLRITSAGAVSGSVWMNGLRYRLRSQINSGDGTLQVTLVLINSPDLTLALRFATEQDPPNGYQFVGTVTFDGVDYDLTAQQAPPYHSSNPSPHQGNYTVILATDSQDPIQVPSGDGYASLSVNVRGLCRFVMTLPDRTTTTASGHVSTGSEYSIVRPLYGRNPKGLLSAKLVFRDIAGVSDLDGTARWIKNLNATPGKPYPGPLDLTRSMIGCRYTRPPTFTNAFAELWSVDHNAWVFFDSTLDRHRVVTWDNRNRIRYYGPDVLRIVFNSRTGLITGTHRDISAGDLITIPFGGALLQKQGLVSGFYIDEGLSGLFTIEPRTE